VGLSHDDSIPWHIVCLNDTSSPDVIKTRMKRHQLS